MHAFELFERRGATYSDRPTLVMCGELSGWNNILALTPYGERLKECRRFLHRLIGSNAYMQRFHGLVEKETHNFLRSLLHKPDSFAAHIRT